MELPWNLCPYCGTPAPGMRRENLTLDEALRPIGPELEEERGRSRRSRRTTGLNRMHRSVDSHTSSI